MSVTTSQLQRWLCAADVSSEAGPLLQSAQAGIKANSVPWYAYKQTHWNSSPICLLRLFRESLGIKLCGTPVYGYFSCVWVFLICPHPNFWSLSYMVLVATMLIDGGSKQLQRITLLVSLNSHQMSFVGLLNKVLIMCNWIGKHLTWPFLCFVEMSPFTFPRCLVVTTYCGQICYMLLFSSLSEWLWFFKQPEFHDWELLSSK